MNTAPSLRDLQLWIKWIITDPRGVTEALSGPAPEVERYKSRYTQPTKPGLEWINKTSITPASRLDIYAEGYFSRILECMEKDFARLKKAVGDEAFTKLVAEYLKAYPSKFTSIDEVGSRFSSFISEFTDIPLEEWVADLALFEWSWIESFYAKDASTKLDWRKELEFNPQVRINIHPSVRLVSSRWQIGRLIQTLDSDKEISPDDFNGEVPSGIVVYRFNDEVLWETLEPQLFQILQSLKNKTPLEQALSQTQGTIEPDVISQNFSRWVERGILCGVHNEENEVSV